jgi:hypothetical protein
MVMVKKKNVIEKKSDDTKRYITAFDPIIKKKVLFLVKGDYAYSVITGHKFKYKKRSK